MRDAPGTGHRPSAATVKASDKYNNADQAKKDAYDTALAEAKDVLAKTDATQKEIDHALYPLGL